MVKSNKTGGETKMGKHKVQIKEGEEFCSKCGLSFENNLHNLEIETPSGIVTITPYDSRYEHYSNVYNFK